MNEFIFKSTPETDRILKEMIGNRIEKIVRCKECKYFKFGNGCFLQSIDYDWEEQMYANDFCSRGEKKDATD